VMVVIHQVYPGTTVRPQHTGAGTLAATWS